jgi:NO-binding membrane sensor protein with MHYT domain
MADENLHPMTLIQNARSSGGGVVTAVPSQAISVGPMETWKSQKVSICHAGTLQLLKAAGCSLHYIMMTAANLVF